MHQNDVNLAEKVGVNHAVVKIGQQTFIIFFKKNAYFPLKLSYLMLIQLKLHYLYIIMHN